MAIYTHFEIAVPSGLHWYDLEIDGDIPISSSSTLLILSNSDGTQTRISGSDFTFVNDEATGGTINSIARTDLTGSTVYEEVTSLNLSLVALLNAGDGNGPAFALIFAGVDTFNGWSGNDLFVGGALGDSFFGSTGLDLVSYDNSPVGLTADLGNAGNNNGFAAGDNYNNSIEGLIGSSFNDSLRGNGLANTLIGGSGNDFLRGRGGADVLDGGLGADYADYFGSVLAVTVNLGNPLLNTNDAFGDTFISIENIRGSDLGDTLIGNGSGNTLRGGLGADTLNGGSGFDFASYSDSSTGLTASLDDSGNNTGEAIGDIYISIEGLRGGNLDDILIGDAGNNILQGGPGGDTLQGGSGFDLADYFNSTEGLTVDLGITSNNTGEAFGDTYSSIEGIRGSAFEDVLRAGNALSVAELIGGPAADTLVGGTGFSYASYRYATGGLTASLANAGNNTGEAQGDSYTSIEGLIGSDFSDTLTGDEFSNWLVGGPGGDVLDGQGGNDVASYHTAGSAVVASLANATINSGHADDDSYSSIEGLGGSSFDDALTGDGGNNRLIGQGGADDLNGGGGFDSAEYLNASTGVTADLATIANNTGEASGDTYISIENLVGSAFDDILRGNSDVNTLTGGSGSDTLDGGVGADTMLGGLGNDTYIVDQGGDVVTENVSEGTDTVQTALTFYQLGANVENLTYTDTNFIVGFGNSANNVIDASSATDTVLLQGLGGADQLIGGAAGDVIYFDSLDTLVQGGGGFDTVVVDTSAGVTLDLGAANVEEAFGGVGNDVLDASDTTNTVRLIGLGGADQLIGGTGSDIIFFDSLDTVVQGGAGVDFAVVYFLETAGVSLDLAASGIEFAYGESGDDILDASGTTSTVLLYGDAGADQLIGGSGSDIIHFDSQDTVVQGGSGLDFAVVDFQETAGVSLDLAAAGVEFAYGGVGNDDFDASGATTTVQLFGLGGADQLTGGSGNDVLWIDSLDTVVQGGAGVDTAAVYFTETAGVSLDMTAAGIEVVQGGAGNDAFTAAGSSQNTRLDGLGGADTLTGGLADDVIFGGEGDDDIFASAGNDYLQGDAGTDTVTYSGNSGDFTITDLGGDFYFVNGPGIGTHTLFQIEVLHFDNGDVIL